MTAARASAVLLGVVTLLLMATGCGVAEPEKVAGNRITVASGAATVTDFDDYVAQELGFYRRHDVEVDHVQTQIASEAIQLLATGEADVGRGLGDAIQANARTDGQLDYISVADPLVRPPHVLVTTGAKRFPQIANEKIGISSPTDNTTIVTEGMLAAKGIDPQRANLIPAGGTSSRLAAMVAGGIKATLLLPPLNFKATGEGLTDMGYVPALMGRDWRYSFTSIVVDRRWAELNHDLLVRFLQARDDALRWLADPAHRDQAIKILIKYTEAEPEAAAKTYDLLMQDGLRAFAGRAAVDRQADATVLSVMRTAGLVSEKGLGIDRFIDDRYAAEARRRNDT